MAASALDTSQKMKYVNGGSGCLKYVHRRVMTKQRNYNNWCIVYVSFTDVTGCGWSLASESGILDLMPMHSAL